MDRGVKRLQLPAELQRLLSGVRFRQNTLGCSSANIYRIDWPEGIALAYLKVQRTMDDDELLREMEVLTWLRGRLPVPEVLHFSQAGDRQYLLISAIPGQNAADSALLSDERAEATVRALARGLRLIHALPVADCPFTRHLDVVLTETRQRVAQGLVDSADLQPENQGRTAEDLLAQLLALRPDREDLVFTHGDYCLPNIILQGGEVSGFIDWGRGGVADRYADLSLVVRSLKHNLGLANGQQLLSSFWQEYGMEHVDEAKINYFILLDELF